MNPEIRIETTVRCGAVPVALFALAELGASVALHLRDDSAFMTHDGRPGPAAVVGTSRHVGLMSAFEAVIEALAPARAGEIIQRLHRFSSTGRALGSLARARAAGSPADAELEDLRTALQAFEAELPAQGWILGEPSAAEASVYGLRPLRYFGVDLGAFPRLTALMNRLDERPASAVAQALEDRIRRGRVVDPEDVLSWWFGPRVGSAQDMEARLHRWFLESRSLDDEMRERFGVTVDQALAGKLDHWAETPSCRLALIVVLDQFTRQVFRGSPLAFAGDAAAQRWCRDGIARGWLAGLAPEEQMMFRMPLVHAEDLALQDEAVAQAEAFAARSEGWMLPFAEIGVEQAKKHRDWVVRFGRFPFRNEALGRPNRPEEVAFLREDPRNHRPARYRDHAPGPA